MIKMQQFRETIKQRKKIVNAILQAAEREEVTEVIDDRDLINQAICELISAKKNKDKYPEATKWQIQHTQELLKKVMKEMH